MFNGNIISCAICQKNLQEYFQEGASVWDHDCFKNFSSDEYELLLNQDNGTLCVGKLAENIIEVDKSSNQLCSESAFESEVLAANKTDCKAPLSNGKGTRGPYKKKDPSLYEDEVTEILIEAVLKRPALWNVTIGKELRGPLQVNEAWDAVHRELGETKFKLDEIKERWRYLKEQFVSAYKIENEKVPTGSARSKKRKANFKFYEQMLELAEGLGCIRRSSESSATFSHQESSIQIDDDTSSSSSTQIKRANTNKDSNKAKRSKSQISIDEELLKFIKSSPQKKAEATTPKKNENAQDGVDGFLIMLAEYLKCLPKHHKRTLQRKIIDFVDDYVEQYEKHINDDSNNV